MTRSLAVVGAVGSGPEAFMAAGLCMLGDTLTCPAPSPAARQRARRSPEGLYRGARRAAYDAAAVGAAAAGAYGYYGGYNSGCYRDAYGSWVCPNQYGY
jgi:hypothetical protein